MAALADPVRRQIFDRLARRALAVGELAAALPVSRSAVSQHLKVLREAGLVTSRSEGTRNIYRLDPRGVWSLRDYLDQTWELAVAAAKRDEQR